jgi:hypothetical protein
VNPVSFECQNPESGLHIPSVERDFLRSDARTPLREEFQAAGIRYEISTNYKPVLQIARECLELPRDSEIESDRVHLRFWIDTAGHSSSPWPKPYFRGLDHLIFMGLDLRSSLLLDLRTCQGLGRLTPDFASDSWFWKTVIFPVVLTSFSGAKGMPVVHCACVAWKGKGALLAGNSGSGKSTLSLALAQAGFGFVSDDRTILSLEGGRLWASGLGPCLKLRPEALVHFPILAQCIPVDRRNMEGAVHLDPAAEFRMERIYNCQPETIIWLEQEQGSKFSIEEVPTDEILCRLEAELPQETNEATSAQGQVIDSLAGRKCFILQHGGNPHSAALALGNFLVGRFENPRPQKQRMKAPLLKNTPRRNDPLRRFTATPLGADFRLMRRHIRIETNCGLAMEYTRRALDCYGPATTTLPDFVWRVVTDPNSHLAPPWPEMNAFSDRQRRYINLGQRSFIAVDLSCREAVAFISERLVRDEVGFASIVLASLFYLCAGTLGLTAISAACIASEGKGILLLGVPRSGKTTSCFLARNQSYEFHADQAVFLEIELGTLTAWGDFWPAAFHAEASTFMPALAECGRQLLHRAASYLCMEKNSSPNAVAYSVVPTACIFLERGAADSPKLIPLSEREFARALDRSVPFNDDSAPQEACQAVRRALGKLPAFRLLYDTSPSTLTPFFHSLLSTHRVVECLG